MENTVYDNGPEGFLTRVEPLLGSSGCIKGSDAASNIVEEMKSAKLMVSRCVVLNVIKATKTPSTLESLISLGGWTVLNTWLSESKKAQNIALLTQVIKVLLLLPVTVDCLKQGNMGKLVKQLTKQDNQEVKTLASELLTKWMAIFKQSKGKKDEDDKPLKRPRDLPGRLPQLPPEKKAKGSPTLKTSSPAGLTESSGFMNAISSQAAAVAKLKKPKKIPKLIPPSSSQSSHSRSNSVTDAMDSSGPSDSKTSTSTVDAKEEEPDQSATNTDDKVKLKKRVSFASDDALTEIFYFEMDESERATIRSQNFMDAAQAEKMRERETMENKLLYHDNMIEMIPWCKPPVITNANSLVNAGCMSIQQQVQMEREQLVLAQLFLSKESLPFSPAEPDPETSKEESEPKLIPQWEPGMEPQEPMMPLPQPMIPPGPIAAPSGPIYNHPQGIPPHMAAGMDPAMMQQSLLPQPHPMDTAQPNQPYYFQPDSDQGQEWGPQRGFPPHRGPPPPQGTKYPNQNYGNPRVHDRGGRYSSGPSTGRHVCKHYTSHGCRMGSACKFLHPPEYTRSVRT